MNEGSLLKRVYDGMALFALLNMLALAWTPVSPIKPKNSSADFFVNPTV